ncbi:hypothetical protein BDA99DRAFT_502967 [Phascolomyces articulosus]|uniref:Uncharacterized protein n=1 Tax=Phascolomyces articulosus TaxID=60185 RepID=A0AAD5PHQ9_9FUNG|nr:hypothetical protein BDA99DRAFT_502967 [Phascolomyces articulosus]
MTFFEIQAAYQTIMTPSSSSSNDITILNNDNEHCYYYNNNGDILNEKDHHQYDQLQMNSNTGDSFHEIIWDDYDNAALIDMLLTTAAAATTNNNDDPLFCMNNTMATLSSPSSLSASSIDDDDRRSSDTPTSLSPPNIINEKPKRKRKSTSNARIGYCQHPKHIDYREENSINTSCSSSPPQCAMKAASLSSSSSTTMTPRRGRPPKGTKAIDKKGVEEGYIWAMTVRPLPKRLEAVVGQVNIKVCLTCLKRSDLDQEYLTHPAYIGPQQQHVHHKRKRK